MIVDTVPPHDFDGEEAVVGAALNSTTWAQCLPGELRAEDFYVPTHRLVYQAVNSLVRRNKSVDTLTVATELERVGKLEQVGGRDYLDKLSDRVPVAAHAPDYAESVRNKWKMRGVLTLADELKGHVQKGEMSADDVIALGETKLVGLNMASPEDGGIDGDDLFFETQYSLEQGDTSHYIRTGIPYVDRALKPRLGYFMILAGRPSMGKTARAVRLALGFATGAPGLDHVSVDFFSLEQSREEIAERFKAQVASVPLSAISERACTQEQLEACASASIWLQGLPLRFYGGKQLASITVPGIRSRVLKTMRQRQTKVVIIDQLNRLIPSVKWSSENEKYTAISRELCNLATSLNVLVIGLHQLSRDVERRENKRPVLSDLRDSGSLEQDADIVCFQFRASYYENRNGQAEQADTETELIVAKGRQTGTGVIRDRYNRVTQTFYQDDTQHDENGAGYERTPYAD